MTRITDKHGTRWVEAKPRKKRNHPRALRFAELKIGDQVVWMKHFCGRNIPMPYIVTDLWFDPVAGQNDETAGRMLAICHISANGEVKSRKYAYTLRGLASQGFKYAEIDYISHRKATVAAQAEGKVIGIGHGHTIRKRPKLPGRSL